ncbi:MAG: bifunctional folylpolyglutamate synthase/dihydrofolate synthase, partial [Chloroflexia bacterium]
ATAALTPILTLLTPVSLDHQAYLGETLAAIAAEKVGAVPRGGLVLSAPQPDEAWDVVLRRCREVGAVLRPVGPAHPAELALAGRHQEINAGLALAAVEALREQGWAIPKEAVERGLREVRWPGRLEVVAGRPLTLVDAAHNPAAAQALAEALVLLFPRRPRLFLLGCSADKDLAGIVAALAPPADGAVATRAHHYRAADPQALAALWHRHGVPTEVLPDVREALERARRWAGPDGLVCACGSFFVVAEVREALGLAVREEWPEPAYALRPAVEPLVVS